MYKLPQIIKRRIGQVSILDLKGELVGPWALRGKEEIEKFLSKEKVRNLVMNLKELTTIDSLGVKAILRNFTEKIKGGIINANISVLEMFSHLVEPGEIKIFRNEEEVIKFFGKEFVQGESEKIPDRRKYARLKTALPIEFYYFDENQKKISFRGIVTDLSEGGLLVEYLDLEELAYSHKKLDPYDFKMLDLKIKLPEEDYVLAKGKVVHRILEGNQVGLGIEFYDISEVGKKKIIEFLK